MRGNLKEFYENYDEGGRLDKDNAHKIEFLTTVHYFDKLLPPGSHILDACAREGKYAFYLAEKGHKVVACDLVEKHVDAMKANPQAGKLAGIEVANALDLSRFEEAGFDVVLCMGALYHLLDSAEREKCVAECLRVLRPGGIFVFAYLNRHTMYVTLFALGPAEYSNYLERLFETGISDVFYGMDFGEAQALADKFKLEKLADIGVDGLGYPFSSMIYNDVTDEQFADYMKYHILTCEQPSILGYSRHGLWIGKKHNLYR